MNELELRVDENGVILCNIEKKELCGVVKEPSRRLSNHAVVDATIYHWDADVIAMTDVEFGEEWRKESGAFHGELITNLKKLGLEALIAECRSSEAVHVLLSGVFQGLRNSEVVYVFRDVFYEKSVLYNFLFTKSVTYQFLTYSERMLLAQFFRGPFVIIDFLNLVKFRGRDFDNDN